MLSLRLLVIARRCPTLLRIRWMSTSKSAPTTEEEVLVEDVNNKRLITLNRPKALNALNISMIRKVFSAIKDARRDDGSTFDLLLIKGAAGGKAFCAGGDVVDVVRSYKKGGDCNTHIDFFKEEYTLNYLIGKLRVPYVALIDGITMGGGCGLSINGRFRVATERTLLAMPETELGLFPDVGATHFLNQIDPHLGLFLALTGHRLRGADVLHSGLATHYVESKNVDALVGELTAAPAGGSVDDVDKLLNKFKPTSLPSFTLTPHLPTIKECFDVQSLEKAITCLEGRSDNDDAFAKKALEELHKMSPTSLKVTFRQITEGRSLSFAQVFPVEYRLVQRFLGDSDFHEGVRAILVDKDKKPKWKPSRISDVKESTIDKYFSPFEDKENELI